GPGVRAQGDGDVRGRFAGFRAWAVAFGRAGRGAASPGGMARPTPTPERKLLLSLAHGASVARGSDIPGDARARPHEPWWLCAWSSDWESGRVTPCQVGVRTHDAIHRRIVRDASAFAGRWTSTTAGFDWAD